MGCLKFNLQNYVYFILSDKASKGSSERTESNQDYAAEHYRKTPRKKKRLPIFREAEHSQLAKFDTMKLMFCKLRASFLGKEILHRANGIDFFYLTMFISNEI